MGFYSVNCYFKPDSLSSLKTKEFPGAFTWFAFLISEELTEAIDIIVMNLGITLNIELILLLHYPSSKNHEVSTLSRGIFPHF